MCVCAPVLSDCALSEGPMMKGGKSLFEIRISFQLQKTLLIAAEFVTAPLHRTILQHP